MDDQDGGLADGIVETAVYEAPEPVRKKDFLAWHRPRKQYVRHFQWCEEILRLVDANRDAYQTLKYLGLPGIDLLDLRYFHSTVCEARNIGFRFLGFNSDARPNSRKHVELNISLDEIRRLNRVHPSSEVMGEDFSWLADPSSKAWQRAEVHGTFDVVNLDLCDGFAAGGPGILDNNYYDATRNLLGLQTRRQHPWLLLLTTRTDQQNIHGGVLEKLLGKYLDNLNNHAVFREASQESFQIDTEKALRDAVGTEGGMLCVFLMGLCKWFLGLALSAQPPSVIELRSVIGYRVRPGAQHEDLISLALHFRPTSQPLTDPLELARNSAALPDEGALSVSALEQVAKRIDADKLLEKDCDLYERMVVATEKLLGLARYEVKAYRRWLERGRKAR